MWTHFIRHFISSLKAILYIAKTEHCFCTRTEIRNTNRKTRINIHIQIYGLFIYIYVCVFFLTKDDQWAHSSLIFQTYVSMNTNALYSFEDTYIIHGKRSLSLCILYHIYNTVMWIYDEGGSQMFRDIWERRQKSRHFTDGIFTCIFVNEINVYLFQISFIFIELTIR